MEREGRNLGVERRNLGVEGRSLGVEKLLRRRSRLKSDQKMARLVMLVNNLKKSPWLLSRCKDNQVHLDSIVGLLRPEDRIKVAVRLEAVVTGRNWFRYLTVISPSAGSEGVEGVKEGGGECVLLGVDVIDGVTTLGLVLNITHDMDVRMDGDGGFCIVTTNKKYLFKPVSVQAMWSALQCLTDAILTVRQMLSFSSDRTRENVLVSECCVFYQSRVDSPQSCINEWHRMDDIESPRDSLDMEDESSENVKFMCLIKRKLRELMSNVDLEEVTGKYLRDCLEKTLNVSMLEHKRFIEEEMIIIMRQMDSPSRIFDHLYLGSEWNASNLNELKLNRVGYILNVTREIDNFFPGVFKYCNVRVYDEEDTQLLRHWNSTYSFIADAKKNNCAVLVHCKMGVSRSASTVIAYAMKEYGWTLEETYQYVKQRRGCIQPNPGFMQQLIIYQGILDASKQRHNKLFRTRSADNLEEEVEGEGEGREGVEPKTRRRVEEPRRPQTWSAVDSTDARDAVLSPDDRKNIPDVSLDDVPTPDDDATDDVTEELLSPTDSQGSDPMSPVSATFIIDNSNELHDILKPALDPVSEGPAHNNDDDELSDKLSSLGSKNTKPVDGRRSLYDFGFFNQNEVPPMPRGSLLRKLSIRVDGGSGLGLQGYTALGHVYKTEARRERRGRRKESLVPVVRSLSCPSRRKDGHHARSFPHKSPHSPLDQPLQPSDDWYHPSKRSGAVPTSADKCESSTAENQESGASSHRKLTMKRSITLAEDHAPF